MRGEERFWGQCEGEADSGINGTIGASGEEPKGSGESSLAWPENRIMAEVQTAMGTRDDREHLALGTVNGSPGQELFPRCAGFCGRGAIFFWTPRTRVRVTVQQAYEELVLTQ